MADPTHILYPHSILEDKRETWRYKLDARGLADQFAPSVTALPLGTRCQTLWWTFVAQQQAPALEWALLQQVQGIILNDAVGGYM